MFPVFIVLSPRDRKRYPFVYWATCDAIGDSDLSSKRVSYRSVFPELFDLCFSAGLADYGDPSSSGAWMCADLVWHNPVTGPAPQDLLDSNKPHALDRWKTPD